MNVTLVRYIVEQPDNKLEVVHPSQLRKSDKVWLYMDKYDWYHLCAYALVEHNCNVYSDAKKAKQIYGRG